MIGDTRAMSMTSFLTVCINIKLDCIGNRIMRVVDVCLECISSIFCYMICTPCGLATFHDKYQYAVHLFPFTVQVVVKSDHCVGRIQCVALRVSVLHNQLEVLDPIHFGLQLSFGIK